MQETTNSGYTRVRLVIARGEDDKAEISKIPEGYELVPSGIPSKGELIVNIYKHAGEPITVFETLMENGYLAENYPNTLK